ncbi:AAA family ATPase [Halobellus clavatus]|uniref:Tetratricopeptide repeat-containing protein n=1 Tax=Halobellus clavatus TaxID=660517 RepID=A0A1H3DCK2_9EURY|nr:AAA family ATPase [Halobellus clavatus]SDX64242.1 Tetratricopeptide repeat-containing protein [Halobellus clavatus]
MNRVGNPYNHQDSVRNPEYFVGRDNELEKIEYELGQALTDRPQFRNIGITGAEGSGKTSLGNMVEKKCKDMNILPVFVRLNKANASDEVSLFKELIDEVTKAIGGSTREGYIQKLAGKTDQVELDLNFVRVYLSPDSNDSAEQNVSEGIVRGTLQELIREAQESSIAIIVDNAQHLSTNEVVLQRLKNIFGDIEGYNLVLVGTEDTFSNITDAFSPVARMFTKVELEPFESLEETKACLIKPLPPEESDLISDQTVREIHQLTEGRPYEINLIADYMYRRYRSNDYDEIKLTPEVIDTVIEQMDTWRRSVYGGLCDEISSLDDRELKLVISSIECPSIHRDWLVNYHILSNFKKYRSKSFDDVSDVLDATLDSLISKGILEENEDSSISFSGGIYEMAYTKYLAYSTGTLEQLGGTSLDSKSALLANIAYQLDSLLTSFADDQYIYSLSPDSSEYTSYSLSYTENSEAARDERDNVLSELYVSVRDHRGQYEKSSISHQSHSHNNKITDIRCNVEWLDSGLLLFVHSQNDEQETRLLEKVEEISNDLNKFGYNLVTPGDSTLLSNAVELAQNHQYDEALDIVDEVINRNEDLPEAWELKAEFEYYKDSVEKSLETVRRVIEMRPNYTDAYLLQSQILFDTERHQDAIESLRQATSFDRSSPDIWAASCHMLANNEMYDEAIEFGMKGKEVDEDNLHVMYHIADAHIKQNNPEKASSVAYQMKERISTIKDDSNDVDYPEIDEWENQAHHIFAQVEKVRENYVRAVKIYRSNISHTRLGGLYQDWAVCELEAGNEEECLDCIRKMLQVENKENVKKSIRESDEFSELENNSEFAEIID